VESSQDVSRRPAALEGFNSTESRALVDAFIEARLFVADRADDGRAVVSIAHDALLHSWPRLRDWLEQNRELLRVRGRVSAAASLWAESGRTSDLLLAEGKPLEEALPLLQVKRIDLSSDERELIRASEAQARGRRPRPLADEREWRHPAGRRCRGMHVLAMEGRAGAGRRLCGEGRASASVTRLTIMVANAFVQWILPPLVAAAPVLYLVRKRMRIPELLRSGMALAIASGLTLLLLLLVFLVAMGDLNRVLVTPK